MAPIQPPFQGLKQRPGFRPKVVHFEVTRGGALWVIGDNVAFRFCSSPDFPAGQDV
jgi:hypothetical protein